MPTLAALIASELVSNSQLTLAALQAGGCECKFQGMINVAIQNCANQNSTNLICISEYMHTDFVLARAQTIGTPRLQVDAVLEVKFNYATQQADILNRSYNAVGQVAGYAKYLANRQGISINRRLVIYLIGDFSGALPPSSTLNDRGWRYMTKKTSKHHVIAPIPSNAKLNSKRIARFDPSAWVVGVTVWEC